MNINTFYYIHGIRPDNECFYTPGIPLKKIPLRSFQSIRLEKKTLVGSKSHTHNFLPCLCRLQLRFRKWFRWNRSTRTLLRREIEGPLPPE
jgi:hypothetical protein